MQFAASYADVFQHASLQKYLCSLVMASATGKKSTGKDAVFQQHENSQNHKSSQVTWASFKDIQSKGDSLSAQSQITDAYFALVQENGMYIEAVADVL